MESPIMEMSKGGERAAKSSLSSMEDEAPGPFGNIEFPKLANPFPMPKFENPFDKVGNPFDKFENPFNKFGNPFDKFENPFDKFENPSRTSGRKLGNVDTDNYEKKGPIDFVHIPADLDINEITKELDVLKKQVGNAWNKTVENAMEKKNPDSILILAGLLSVLMLLLSYIFNAM